MYWYKTYKDEVTGVVSIESGLLDEYNPAPKDSKITDDLESVVNEARKQTAIYLDQIGEIKLAGYPVLWTTENTVKEMKAEAKRRGLRGYSKLREAELIELLNGTSDD